MYIVVTFTLKIPKQNDPCLPACLARKASFRSELFAIFSM